MDVGPAAFDPGVSASTVKKSANPVFMERAQKYRYGRVRNGWILQGRALPDEGDLPGGIPLFQKSVIAIAMGFQKCLDSLAKVEVPASAPDRFGVELSMVPACLFENVLKLPTA